MKRLLMASFLTAIAAAAFAAEPKLAGNWPQFRGPNSSGVAPDSKPLPEKFGPTENVIWKAPLPVGHSSPCIWGDRIFLTGFDPTAKSLETLALDRRTGTIVWRRPANAAAVEKVHEVSSPANATPATDGERVYVYFASFGLICYDFSGVEIWRLPLPVPRAMFGSGTSPVVAGDLVLLNAAYAPQAALLAINRGTGEIVWKKESPSMRDGYATPTVWTHDGVREVMIHSQTRLTAFGLTDGAEKWWVTLTSNACSTPVIGDGRLFVSTWMIGGEPSDRVKLPTYDELLEKYDTNKDGLISKDEFPADLSFLKRVDAGNIAGADVKIKPFFDQLDMNKDGQISRIEWAMVQVFANRPVEHGLLAIKPGGQRDVTATNVLWREPKATPEVPSPVCYRGRVYQVRDGGIVSCLNAETGKLMFRERLGPGGAYFSSPVAGDGKVYAASQRGVVVVIAAGDSFKVLSRNDLQEPVVATPALVDGTIYLRTEKHLYAFGGPAK